MLKTDEYSDYHNIAETLTSYHLNIKNLNSEDKKIALELWKEFTDAYKNSSDIANYSSNVVNAKLVVVLFKTLILNGYLVTLREKNIDEITF